MKYAFIALILIIIAAIIGICYALNKPKKDKGTVEQTQAVYNRKYYNRILDIALEKREHNGSMDAFANASALRQQMEYNKTRPKSFPPFDDIPISEETYVYCLRFGAKRSGAHPNAELRNQPIDFTNPTHVYILPTPPPPFNGAIGYSQTWRNYRDSAGHYIKRELATRIGKVIFNGLSSGSTSLFTVDYMVIDGVFYIVHPKTLITIEDVSIVGA